MKRGQGRGRQGVERRREKVVEKWEGLDGEESEEERGWEKEKGIGMRERGLRVPIPHCWMLLDAATEAPLHRPELRQWAISQCSLSAQGSGGAASSHQGFLNFGQVKKPSPPLR